jgi:hypothetical protein
MRIVFSENEITGRWLPDNKGGLVADEACRRIDAPGRSYLMSLGLDVSGWEALNRDPVDGRLWGLTYPQGEMQGGGPPQLRCLSVQQAREKFGSIAEKA